MASPQISFVVPCYNYGRFLPECLESIFGQEGNYNFEIIAIDDCSTDHTQEVLARYRDGSRLRVITHARNQGHVATISEGLMEARGELVARIDPDDRYRLWFLSETVPKFAAHPEVGLVYGDMELMDANGNLANRTCDRVHGGRDFKGNELIALLHRNFIGAPTVIARRQAWLETLPMPDHLAFSDWYFTMMMARRHEFYYIHRVLADYRVHGTNHHTNVVLNRTEEPSIFYLLDLLYAQKEADPMLERAKQAARGGVYGAQYLMVAEKYFGVGMNADARRCYLEALRRAPLQTVSWGMLRRMAATLLNRKVYEGIKQTLRPSQS